MRRSVLSVIAVTATLGALVSGCSSSPSSSPSSSSTPGSSTPSATALALNGAGSLAPPEALKKIQAAVAASTSVHFAGRVDDGKDTYYLDVNGETKGDVDATVKVGSDLIEIRVIGSTGYLHADSAFWRKQGGAAVAKLVDGRWIAFPKGDTDFASLLSLTDVGSIISESKPQTLTKAKPTVINGQPVFGLVDPSKDEGGTLYAAATGQPLPVRLVGAKSQAADIINFTAWNQPIKVVAPPASQTVNLDALAG